MGGRCRTAWIAIATALACAVLLPAQAAGADDGRRMIEEVNELRARHGLAPFAASDALSRSSARYAGWQMRADWFGHVDGIRADRAWSSLGEAISIHTGFRPRVPVTVRRWARSPSHAALLLSPTFRSAGAGLSRGRFRGGRATIWVMQFGLR